MWRRPGGFTEQKEEVQRPSYGLDEMLAESSWMPGKTSIKHLGKDYVRIDMNTMQRNILKGHISRI